MSSSSLGASEASESFLDVGELIVGFDGCDLRAFALVERFSPFWLAAKVDEGIPAFASTGVLAETVGCGCKTDSARIPTPARPSAGSKLL